MAVLLLQLRLLLLMENDAARSLPAAVVRAIFSAPPVLVLVVGKALFVLMNHSLRQHLPEIGSFLYHSYQCIGDVVVASFLDRNLQKEPYFASQICLLMLSFAVVCSLELPSNFRVSMFSMNLMKMVVGRVIFEADAVGVPVVGTLPRRHHQWELCQKTMMMGECCYGLERRHEAPTARTLEQLLFRQLLLMVVDGRRSEILSVAVLVEQQHRPTNERVFVRRCLSPLRMLLLEIAKRRVVVEFSIGT